MDNRPEVASVKVHAISPSKPVITVGCAKCKRVIKTTESKFVIGISVTDGRSSSKYFLGDNPPIICCGEVKSTIRTFDTEEEVLEEVERVEKHMAEHESTKGLRLLSYVLPSLS